MFLPYCRGVSYNIFIQLRFTQWDAHSFERPNPYQLLQVLVKDADEQKSGVASTTCRDELAGWGGAIKLNWF